MKTSLLAATLSLAGFFVTQAQSQDSASQANGPAPTAFRVVDSGPNHRIWQNETYEVAPDGEIRPHIHRVTELASGLNYLDTTSGQWVESKEQIEAYADGAIARQGQHQVIFANNLNSEGAIDMQTPDGKRLRSNILGLIYLDRATGNAVWIALLQDSTGQMISDNEVLYPNAFDGVNADVHYTYRKGSFEQDVILNEQPPTPEAFGLNSQNVELEVVTEFIDPPATTVKNLSSGEQTSAGLEADQGISWGAMSLGRGQAFNLEGGGSVPVAKQYLTIQGRKFLVERVRLKTIQHYLADLPEQASIQTPKHSLLAMNELLQRQSPPVKKASRPLKTASRALPMKGFVLDYVTLSASYTNYTFQADTTYYLSGALNLYGTNTFEGGTVIKYASGASITEVAAPFTPKVVFSSGAYRPVVFTAKDDNTVGETVGGSSGNPSGYYANPALSLPSGGSQTVSGFRISYANVGLSVPGTSLTAYDAQIINSGFAISASGDTNYLRNVLLANNQTNFSLGGGVVMDVQNGTFSQSFGLVDVPVSATTNSTLYLTNCVFSGITNGASTSFALTAGWNGFYNTTPFGASTTTNTSYPFTVVGAGSYYLTNGCAFADSGTPNVDTGLLTDITNKTVYPPIVYSNTPVAGGNFSLCVQRDTNTPDLGYHYDPLDYCFGGVSSGTNAVFTFTAGTAVGWFEFSGKLYGISLANTASVNYNGTVTAPCVQARYSTVQEGGNGNWTAVGGLGCMDAYGTAAYNRSIAATINATFTLFACHAWQPNVGQAYSSDIIYNFTHCVVNSGSVSSFVDELCFTNCLLLGTVPGVNDDHTYGASLNLVNCTMHEGRVISAHFGSTTWPINIRNCAFENVDFSQMFSDGQTSNPLVTYCDYNAFITNSARLPLWGTHDVTNFVAFNWQTSWLGNFYLPSGSPLIDAGSTTADQVGLYHFTTQAGQIKETNSPVDIGYHYVATDAYGNPLDVNGDGTPDYLEDANGNGLVDLGETNWALGILIQPVSQTVAQGSNVTLTVTAAGLSPLNYQWYFNSNGLANATNAILAINNIQTSNAGPYFVIVSNLTGSITSSVAALAVVTPPVIAITNPPNNAVIFSSNVVIMASATDTAGLISVQFFQGSILLGTVTNSSFTYTWSNAPVGNYALTAVATDCGLSSTSAIVNITVFPLTNTTNLALWFKADTITGLTNNASVATWPDSGSFANNASQSSPDSQPFYLTNMVNGYPVVRFNGSNSWLTVSPSTFKNGAAGAEAFVVLKVNDPTNGSHPLWDMGGTLGYESYSGDSGGVYDAFAKSSVVYLGVPSQPLTQYHVYEVLSQTGNWSAWINGILQGQDLNNTCNFPGGDPALGRHNYNNYGGVSYFAGDIAEILIFKRGLTDSERKAINNYLNGKYGLKANVAILGPTNNVVWAAPANIPINASVSGMNPARVKFFDGEISIGEADFPYISTFSITWENVSAGTHSLTARAYDGGGEVLTSSIVNVIVDISPNVALTSPLNNAVFPTGSTITLSASASDADGAVTQVQFFQGTSSLGSVTTPYTLGWSNVTAGSYAITAVATDNQGITVTSSVANITVEAAPSVTLTNPVANARFVGVTNISLGASASDADGTVTQVQFFQGVTSLGTVTTAPYTMTWSNVAVGAYSLTARAMDNLGLTATSAVLNITVAGISITNPPSPPNNVVLTAPATIPIGAAVVDNVPISQVQFFQGSTNLGTVTTVPYALTWSNVTSGAYALTARATDTGGLVLTSAVFYAIVDTNVLTSDRDADGLSDYLENLEGRNPVVAGAVADTNSIVNLQVYTPLK